MIRLVLRMVVFVASAAVGLLAAAVLLDDFTLGFGGLLIDVIVFAALQGVLSPFIFKVAARSAPAVLGAVGIVSTFVALLLTSLTGTLSISGAGAWLLATLIVWLVTMLATLLLPLLVFRKALNNRRGNNRKDPTTLAF